MIIQAVLTRRSNNIMSSFCPVLFTGKCRIKLINVTGLVNGTGTILLLTSPQLVNSTKSPILINSPSTIFNTTFNNMFVMEDVFINGRLDFSIGPYTGNNLTPGTQSGSVWAILTLDIEYM